MRLVYLVLLLAPVMLAGPITPTVTETLIEIGNVGFTNISSSVTSTSTNFDAGISGNASTFPGPPNGGGQAEADITLQAAFLVEGTGTGYLHYTSGGESDGSGGGFNASYRLNDIDASCLVDCAASGIDPFPLGTPFLLTETGTAYAFSGPNYEDAGYQVSVDFTVTDVNGFPLAFTEVALPTPEPASFALLAFGLLAGSLGLLGAERRVRRPV